MTGQYIVQGIFALAGIVSLLASLLNWDWFFTTRNAQTIVRNVGATGQDSSMGYWELSSLEWLYSSLWKHGKPSLFDTFFQTKEHKYKRLQKYVLLFLCLKQLS